SCVRRELVLGYMGDSRLVKGFPLLPGLVRNLLARPGFAGRFVIQCASSASAAADGSLPAGVAELERIAAESGERVTLISKRLSAEEYVEIFAGLDAVILPYNHPAFDTGTSNVFAEAVAL